MVVDVAEVLCLLFDGVQELITEARGLGLVVPGMTPDTDGYNYVKIFDPP